MYIKEKRKKEMTSRLDSKRIFQITEIRLFQREKKYQQLYRSMKVFHMSRK